MNFKCFKELVKKAKTEYPIWFGIDSDETPNPKILFEAEAEIGAKLPNDYKDFIFEYGGGYFAFSNVFSLDKGSDWSLVELNQSYKELRKNYVLISENGTGDFY